MQPAQRWIVGLLLVIAILLGVVIAFLVRPSEDSAPAGNMAGIEQSNMTAPAEDVRDRADPIDAAVDNVLAEQPAAPVEIKVASIPKPFWGLWTRRIAACGQPGEDDSALEITARSLQFWEASGTVRSVTLKNPIEIEIAASFTGEGEAWEATSRYTLSRTRQEMLVSDGEGQGVWYKRCSTAG